MYDSDDELGSQYDELGPQHQLLLERQRQLRQNPFHPNNQGRNFAFANRHESDLSRLGRENLGDPYSDVSSYESDSDSDIEEQYPDQIRQLQRENPRDAYSEEYSHESDSDSHIEEEQYRNQMNYYQGNWDSLVFEFDTDCSAASGDDCEPGSNHCEYDDSGRENFNNLTCSDRNSEIDRELRDMLGPYGHLRVHE